MKLEARGGPRAATRYLLPLGNSSLFLAKAAYSRQRARRRPGSPHSLAPTDTDDTHRSQNQQRVPPRHPQRRCKAKSRPAPVREHGNHSKRGGRHGKQPRPTRQEQLCRALAVTLSWKVLWKCKRNWKYPIKMLNSVTL